MLKDNKIKFKKGAASFYIVAFSMGMEIKNYIFSFYVFEISYNE